MISASGEEISLMDVMKDEHGDVFDSKAGEDDDVEIKAEINLQSAVDEYEKGLIKYACQKYGSTRKAAKAIGISQTQLVRKKKKYEI